MPAVDINGTSVEFPDTLTGDALNEAVRMAAGQMSMQPREGRSTGESILRGVGLAGQGLNNALGATAGAIPDAVGWLLRQAGLPSSEPGQYTKMIQGGLNALGRNDTPDTPLERNIMAAGEGVGNAASVLLPAGLAARGLQAGTAGRGVAQSLASSPVLQSASGALGGAVTQATDSPVAGMVASMAAPAVAAGGRGLVAVAGAMRQPELSRLVEVAKAENIPLTPAQESGSRMLRSMESVFTTLPSTAGRQAGIADTQRVAIQRAALARAGTDADRATPDVLRATRAREGGLLTEIAGRNTMQVDAPLLGEIRRLAADVNRRMPPDKSRPILAQVQDFLGKIEPQQSGQSGILGTVPGKTYAELDSALAEEIRGTMNGKVRAALGELRDTMRLAMDASISPADAELWKLTRNRYANFKTIQRAMNQTTAGDAGTAAGNIPLAALAQGVAQGPARNFAMGHGDMNDLARVGNAFVRGGVPDSGTAGRLFMQGALTGGGAMYGGAGLEGIAGGAAAGLLVPRAIQEAYIGLLGNNLRSRKAQELLSSAGLANVRPVMEGQ